MAVIPQINEISNADNLLLSLLVIGLNDGNDVDGWNGICFVVGSLDGNGVHFFEGDPLGDPVGILLGPFNGFEVVGLLEGDGVAGFCPQSKHNRAGGIGIRCACVVIL